MDAHVRDLRYFVAVAEEEHITRAAERLYVSQPALSKQIRSLERQLGFALFERVARGVVLTDAGRELLPAAREMLAQWDSGVRRARALASVTTLVIGLQTAVGRGLTRRILDGYREMQPAVVPSLRLVDWRDPTAGLADESSDVAFVWLGPSDKAFDTVTVARERRCVVLAEISPLASRDEVDFADIVDLPFVALPESAGPLRDWWLADDRRTRPASIGAVADNADAVLEFVASGVGVALIAEGNAQLYPRPGVVSRPVRDLDPAQLALAYRASDRRPEVLDFVNATESVVFSDR